MHLLSVRNYVLIKEAIIEEPFSIQIVSNHIVKQVFQLSIDYLCEEGAKYSGSLLTAEFNLCSYKMMIVLNIHANVLSHK